MLLSPRPSAALSPLSLHDALPICAGCLVGRQRRCLGAGGCQGRGGQVPARHGALAVVPLEGTCDRRGLAAVTGVRISRLRSEEHTSELQSRRDLVCRLLLEKKKST